jgi:protein-disulfide isomerase
MHQKFDNICRVTIEQTKMRKLLSIPFCIFFVAFAISAQPSDQIIARSSATNFLVADLMPSELREAFEQMDATIAAKRKESLEDMIGEMLVDNEAASRKMLVDNLLSIEVYRKVTNPSEAKIQEVYDANKAQLGNTTLAEIRGRLIKFIRQQDERKAYLAFVAKLKSKYKPVSISDVNSNKLKPTDTLVTIGNKQIIAAKFEEKMALSLFDLRVSLYEQAKASIEQTAFAKFVIAESAAQNLSSEDYIRREISDKLKDYSEPERNRLQALLQDRLFQKYKFSFVLPEPVPPVQKIDVANGVSKGSETSPVTVVMFTDFQCPACSATHPILREALKSYGDGVRFVVRNFPLVTLHANALNAAKAAQAARTQGKFFEYIDILYSNQDKLDIPSLKKYASDLGLNRKQFDLDFASKKYEPLLQKDIADGIFYGINSTPTVFINGVKIRELSLESFKAAIEKGLKK